MKKLMNKKGFTLMEMLIVVAIIVILVAISIPTFSSQLDNAKEATDDANFRAAKGVAEVADMTADGWKTILGTAYDDTDAADTDYTIYYNIETGTFQEAKPTGYGQSSDNKGKVIKVVLNAGVMTNDSPEWE